MKKLLSLMLAVMFGFTVSAQITADAYWENFSGSTVSMWTVDQPNNGQNWDIDDVLGNEDPCAYAPTTGIAIYTPSFTLTSSDVANGSFSAYVLSAKSDENVDCSSDINLMVIINGTLSATYQAASITNADGWKRIAGSLSALPVLNNLTGTSTVQFGFVHASSTGDAYLLLDDFKIRKRADAFVVKFHPGDGSGSMPDMVSYASDGQYNFTIPTCSFTAPNGTQFAYWYTLDSESNTYGLFPNDEVGLDQDYIFYAIWGETFAVNFNSNGGNGTMTAGTGIQFVGYVVPENTFTRQGYTFTGWNTEANGSGYDYEPGDTIYNMDNQTGDLLSTSVTLYAQWEEGEGGQGGEQGGQGGEQGGEQGGQGGEQGGTTAINSAAMSSISVYPNPAHNMVRVNGASISRLELMDLTGRTVRTVESGNTVDMSGLNNGVYMLRITAAEGSAVRRIVKK